MTQLIQGMKEFQQSYIIQKKKKPPLLEYYLNYIHIEICDIGHSSIINMSCIHITVNIIILCMFYKKKKKASPFIGCQT